MCGFIYLLVGWFGFYSNVNRCSQQIVSGGVLQSDPLRGQGAGNREIQ